RICNKSYDPDHGFAHSGNHNKSTCNQTDHTPAFSFPDYYPATDHSSGHRKHAHSADLRNTLNNGTINPASADTESGVRLCCRYRCGDHLFCGIFAEKIIFSGETVLNRWGSLRHHDPKNFNGHYFALSRSKKMFFPVAERGIAYATVHSLSKRPRSSAAAPPENMIRLSTLWIWAVFTAEPIAMPRSVILTAQFGPEKNVSCSFGVAYASA